jgi:hypothetical protein
MAFTSTQRSDLAIEENEMISLQREFAYNGFVERTIVLRSGFLGDCNLLNPLHFETSVLTDPPGAPSQSFYLLPAVPIHMLEIDACRRILPRHSTHASETFSERQ